MSGGGLQKVSEKIEVIHKILALTFPNSDITIALRHIMAEEVNKETVRKAGVTGQLCDTPKSASGDAWDLLDSLTGTLEGPEDWSSQTDHYLYGTPKQ